MRRSIFNIVAIISAAVTALASRSNDDVIYFSFDYGFYNRSIVTNAYNWVEAEYDGGCIGYSKPCQIGIHHTLLEGISAPGYRRLSDAAPNLEIYAELTMTPGVYIPDHTVGPVADIFNGY